MAEDAKPKVNPDDLRARTDLARSMVQLANEMGRVPAPYVYESEDHRLGGPPPLESMASLAASLRQRAREIATRVNKVARELNDK